MKSLDKKLRQLAWNHLAKRGLGFVGEEEALTRLLSKVAREAKSEANREHQKPVCSDTHCMTGCRNQSNLNKPRRAK